MMNHRRGVAILAGLATLWYRPAAAAVVRPGLALLQGANADTFLPVSTANHPPHQRARRESGGVHHGVHASNSAQTKWHYYPRTEDGEECWEERCVLQYWRRGHLPASPGSSSRRHAHARRRVARDRLATGLTCT